MSAAAKPPPPPPPGSRGPVLPDTELGSAILRIYVRTSHGRKPLPEGWAEIDLLALSRIHTFLRAKNWPWGLWLLIKIHGIDHATNVLKEGLITHGIDAT